MSFELIPYGPFQQIFLSLSINDLMSSRLSCKSLCKKISNDSSLWQEIAQKIHLEVPQGQLLTFQSWKKLLTEKHVKRIINDNKLVHFTQTHQSMNEVLLQIKSLSLTFIHFTGIPFKNFPLSVCQIGSLQWLSISHSQITTVPEQIGQLKSLKTLKLVDNQIEFLSNEIGELKKLELLELAHNKISNISSLKCLNVSTLSLSHNKVEPSEENFVTFKSLLNINSLYLRNNLIKRESIPAKYEPFFNKLIHFTL